MNSFEEVRVGGITVQNPQLLAEGGFGLVYSVTDRNGAEYVLKKCSIQRQEDFNTVQKEVQILDKLRDCPYVVNIVSSHVAASKEGLILLEICKGGHLLDRLNSKRSSGGYLDTRSICQIFGQILSAVKVMHEWRPCVTNRDLKLENVLFGGLDNNTVKLCDFGSCVYGTVPIRNQTEKTNAEEVINKETTPAYRAPEMVDLYMRAELTFKTDIWALGCILYTLCYCIHPFQEGGSLATLNGITNFPTSPAVPKELNTLISRMCDIDPEARPTATQSIGAVTAIQQGTPLPEFSLSEEVIQLRRERQQQMVKRAEKDAEVARKAAARGKNAILATKKEGQGKVVGGSVAAQRLARMRGEEPSSSSPVQSSAFFADTSESCQPVFNDGFNDALQAPSNDVFGSDDLFGGANADKNQGDSGFSTNGDIQGFLGSPKTQLGQDAMTAYFDKGNSNLASGASNIGDFNSDSGGFNSFADFDKPVAASSDPFAANIGHISEASSVNNIRGASANTALVGDSFDAVGPSPYGGAGAVDPFTDDNKNTPFFGGDRPEVALESFGVRKVEEFSEFSRESPRSQTPSRPLSEAFGSSSAAPTADNVFQRPPSGAFEATGSTQPSFDAFTPVSSRPTSGAFDEFSSLPAAGQSFDDQDPHNASTVSSGSAAAAAAFSSLPSAPPTPHSSMKLHESPIPVAQPVKDLGISTGGYAAMASVVGKTEEVSVGGSEYIVDALHNMSFKGTPSKSGSANQSSANLFDFNDDTEPGTDIWNVGATASLNVPSGPPPEDPFGNEPALMIPKTTSMLSNHSPGDMESDLFGDGKGKNGGVCEGNDAKADILSLYNTEGPGPGVVSPSAPAFPNETSALRASAYPATGTSFEQPRPVMLRPPPIATNTTGAVPQSYGYGNAMNSSPARSPMPLHTTTAFGVMNAPAMGGRILLHTGRGSTGAEAFSNSAGSMTGSPQMAPLGMSGPQGMDSAMRGQYSQSMAMGSMAPQGMHQQLSTPFPRHDYGKVDNAAYGASLQPAGLNMNDDQSFDPSPLASPSNSRPNSMGLPAPPAAKLTVTRGHIPTSVPAPPDPFGELASFGGKK